MRVQGDSGKLPADEAPAMSERFFGGERAERGHALFDGGWRDGRRGVKRPPGRAGARRKRKQVEIAEGQYADKIERLLEFAVALARKANHDVGAEGEVRACGAQESGDFVGVMPGAVTAVHAAEDSVGAGLKRQVRVAGEPRSAELADTKFVDTKFSEEGDELAVPIHWLDRAEAQARQCGLCEDGAGQIHEGLWSGVCQRLSPEFLKRRSCDAGRKIVSPAAEVDA